MTHFHCDHFFSSTSVISMCLRCEEFVTRMREWCFFFQILNLRVCRCLQVTVDDLSIIKVPCHSSSCFLPSCPTKNRPHIIQTMCTMHTVVSFSFSCSCLHGAPGSSLPCMCWKTSPPLVIGYIVIYLYRK